jgi:acyl carrier protein
MEHPEKWGGVVDLDDLMQGNDVGTTDAATKPAGDLKDVWRTCEDEQRRVLLRDHVRVLVAAVMGLPSPQSLNPAADFFELGMDSLMSVVLQRALAATLGEEVPASKVFDYPTVEALADYLTTIAAADRATVDAYESLPEAALSERVS